MMDGLLLGFIRRELSAVLIGARVDRILQPEKDELHFVLRGQAASHRLLLCASSSNARIHLTREAKVNPVEPPMFCMLLRKLLGNGRISDIRQIGGDRIIEIIFACVDEMGERVERILSCEIMGRHSNIILRDESGRIHDAIRHVGADVSRVREVKPGLPYTPPPAQEKLDPGIMSIHDLAAALEGDSARLDKAISGRISGISVKSAQELAYRLTAQESPLLDAEARRALAGPLHQLFQALPGYAPPTLQLSGQNEAIDVLPFRFRSIEDNLQKDVPEGVSAALDMLYTLRDLRERIAQKSASLSRSVKNHIERCEHKLTIHRENLANEARIEEARANGELLIANLHAIHKSMPSVEVMDYASGLPRLIPMEIRLSPSQNAQRYFKQYQKLRSAQAHAREQIGLLEAEHYLLESQLDDLRKCESIAELDEIRRELARAGYVKPAHGRNKKEKPVPSKPLQVLSSDGITIYVGKNSTQNDKITASAPPDATWLHAKNMAGSHVIIETAQEPPDKTLHEAAMLAAWYSRGYRSGQVPVDYTRRKHVKKPSGAAPGFVTYTHQRTVYITPDEELVNKLIGVADRWK